MFGNRAFLLYEKLHNQPAMADFVQSAEFNPDGTVNFATIRIAFYVRIAYCALSSGGAKANKPFVFEEGDVADWLDDEKNMLQIIDLFTETLPKVNKSATEGDNKETPGETKRTTMVGSE